MSKYTTPILFLVTWAAIAALWLRSIWLVDTVKFQNEWLKYLLEKVQQ